MNFIYVVSAWVLLVKPQNCSHVLIHLTWSQCLQIEKFVMKLHTKLCFNLNVNNEIIDKIHDIFWTKSKKFQSNRFPFLHPCHFLTKDELEDHTHTLNELFSLPYTWILWFVACRVTSKRLGIGVGKSSWSVVKMIKDGKRSNLSGNYLEKHAILYAPAHLEEARNCNNHECHNDSGDKFTD